MWTIGRLRNSLDAHLGQIICDKNLNIVTLTLTLWPINSVYWLPFSSHTAHHPLQTPCLPWISLYHSETDARFLQDGQKAVWSIPYVSVASFFPSLKHNFIIYRSSKVSSRPDCIFEIHQLWKSGFSRMYSNSCWSCSFKAIHLKLKS